MHFLRNVLAKLPEDSSEAVTAAIRTIFAQRRAEQVRNQIDVIATTVGRQLTRVEAMLREATDDITAFADVPTTLWRNIWSTNQLERVNKGIKRRTDVFGVLPNPSALQRIAGPTLIETHGEWQVTDGRYLSEASMQQITTPATETTKEMTPP